MVQTINWIPPNNQNVGSVLIYKADNSTLDSLGSRTIIDTIGAYDNGNFVTSYTDVVGTTNNVYRIQFWDGVGSSVLSDPVSYYYQEQLADYNNVLRLSRLNYNMDIGSDIVFNAIEDASIDVFNVYGDPIKKTAFFIDSQRGVMGRTYNFTGDYGPVYQLREIFVEISSDFLIIPSDQYEVDYRQGNIKFSESFIDEYQGRHVFVNWVPKAVNTLAEHIAALRLHEGQLIIRGGNVDSPAVQHLQNRIEDLKDGFRPKAAVSARQLRHRYVAGYRFIPQQIKRTNLYFNN